MLFIFLVFGFLAASFSMAIAKRVSALVGAFRVQSLFLFLYTLCMAIMHSELELYIVCALVFALKVVAIPHLFMRIVRRINAGEDLGMIINSQVSLLIVSLLSALSYIFAARIMPQEGAVKLAAFSAALAVICIGLFLMVCRLKALSQVLGLLVMENGIFLAACAFTGGMPFFVEIALFFDVFIFIMIIEVFIYRINRLFTHIDTSKLNRLKG